MEKRFIDWMKKEGKSKAFIAMYKKTPVGF